MLSRSRLPVSRVCAKGVKYFPCFEKRVCCYIASSRDRSDFDVVVKSSVTAQKKPLRSSWNLEEQCVQRHFAESSESD